MHFILYDLPEDQVAFQPFTFSRPVSELRVGILTIREKWEKMLGAKVCYFTSEYLQEKFPLKSNESHNFLINSAVLPNLSLIKTLVALKNDQAIFSEKGTWVASRIGHGGVKEFRIPSKADYTAQCRILQHKWEIFTLNGEGILADFECITKNRQSEALSSTNRVTAPENIFLEPGAVIEHAIINASSGPVYIGAGAEIMEGALIRGPFAMGEGAVLKMGAKIYGPTTIGPHSKVGGEINNSVIFGYSNKAHDGFLGNSVIGEWCNLGADTNNSNLKNNYSEVRIHSYKTNALESTGLTFCGLFMGDHSKAGINTMFNTGTVVGFSGNIFGAGFPDKHIPSFTWGGTESSETFDLEKAIQLARAVYERRKLAFSKVDEQIFREIFRLTVLQKN